ncbi:Acyl-CoA N-acyltransferase [Lasiodiplodia theobromae]|nr:Acyl-CoA N-acyltransferase [Lasiodiplodia theobromae]KAF4546641.1 Acyl-CoA N-acyltransferase [Lasiodiplodia theobromae]KAF9632052.1 Acyl-CoA N-acyltransferase [Lasiodiplodia theobromae]
MLQLSRATEADIDAFIDPIYAAFEGVDIRTMFFGHDTPASRESTKARIAGWMREGNQNVWLKVVEQETGRIVSGSWWMIYPHWTPNPDITPETAAAAVSLDFLEGDDRTMTEDLMRDWVARRVRHMYGHPHILLALLFTAPDAQRLGAGSMQVQWGTALADQLLVPWYVEATPAGHRLYAANGAADVEKVQTEARPRDAKKKASDGRDVWVCEYTLMKREPRRTAVEREARAVVKN